MPGENKLYQGRFTSTGTATDLILPSEVDYFEITNHTNRNSTANPGVTKEAHWQRGLADASAWVMRNTNGAATDQSTVITTDGFTLVRSDATVQLGTTLPATAITAATPQVVSMASTAGLANGDVVLVSGSTGQLQTSGIPYTISSVVLNTSITLANSVGAGFAAAATAANITKVLYPNRFLPKLRYVTQITQAASAVVRTSVDHQFSVGQTVRMHVSSDYGMTEMDGLLGEITAVTASTFTLNIDSTGFTAFAFPTSAVAAGGVTPAHVTPEGDTGNTIFAGSFTDNDYVAMRLGTGVVGANSDVIYWRAWAPDYLNNA